jgi:undecaprenyl-diphosphatase
LTILHAILFGLIQGITEFLPISSTAHLTVAEKLLLGDPLPLAFDVLLHVGTLVAVITYFWEDILKIARGVLGRDPAGRRLAWLLLLAMIPTVVFAVATMHLKESAKGHLWIYGACLVLTAVMLWGANRLAELRSNGARKALAAALAAQADRAPGEGKTIPEMNALDALCVGAIQGVGGGFGLSRSGSTISVGVFRGLGLSESTRFSFLLGVPTILAAALVEGRHLLAPSHDAAQTHALPLLPCVVGVLAAGLSGYFAVGLLDRLTRRPRLGGFALYCAVAGALVMVLGAL